MRARVLVATLATLVVAGCKAVGPDYERPRIDVPGAMPAPASFTASEGTVRITASSPEARWWTVFHDARLDRLIGEALAGNRDLRAAVARVHAARAVVKESFAPLLPTVSALGAYDYAKLPANLVGTGGSSPAGAPTQGALGGKPFQVWAGVADMSYELDLWGRIRRALEAARADEAATEEDRKTVEITTLSEVAEAYFDLGQAEADLAIARDAVRLREETVRFLEERFEKGVAPELDARRARGELARARAQVPDAERRKAIAEHRLAVLLGHMPTLHFEGRPPAAFELPPELPLGLPAALLERRPDIRAAELRLTSSNARIGEAIANFFPKVSLFGAFGYASLDVWKLAQPGSQLFAVGPQISIPIFEGGRTYARVLETEATRDEATASYERTVLNAFREVADAIVSVAAEAKVRDAEKVNVAESEAAVALVTEQYDKGLTPYLNVLDAQRTLLQARQDLVQAQRLLLSSMVQLEKALGGGWSEVPADDAPPKSGG
jgi:multidrug efflux system outer membrane protein